MSMTSKEIAKFLTSLKIEKTMHDLKSIEERHFSKIYYKIQAPDNDYETLNISPTVYYDKEAALYFGFLEIDKLRNALEKITSILRRRNVDENTIQEILSQKFDS